MSEDEAREVAYEIAESLGLRVDHAKGIGEDFLWDGYVLAGDMPSYDIVHDCAHWIVAHPSRRGTPEFGLGASPDTWDDDEADERMQVTHEFAGREEQKASLLGILIERDRGLDWRGTYDRHNWPLTGTGLWRLYRTAQVLRRLHRGGFIDERLKPILKAQKRIPGTHSRVYRKWAADLEAEFRGLSIPGT